MGVECSPHPNSRPPRNPTRRTVVGLRTRLIVCPEEVVHLLKRLVRDAPVASRNDVSVRVPTRRGVADCNSRTEGGYDTERKHPSETLAHFICVDVQARVPVHFIGPWQRGSLCEQRDGVASLWRRWRTKSRMGSKPHKNTTLWRVSSIEVVGHLQFAQSSRSPLAPHRRHPRRDRWARRHSRWGQTGRSFRDVGEINQTAHATTSAASHPFCSPRARGCAAADADSA